MLGANLTQVLYMSEERSTDHFLSQPFLYCACPTDILGSCKRNNIIYVLFNIVYFLVTMENSCINF
jgi:hypothetical protein